VIDQATNEGFLSLGDLSFLDYVSHSSMVKNYIEKKFNAVLETELPHLETLEKSLRTSGTRVGSPTYSKIREYYNFRKEVWISPCVKSKWSDFTEQTA
jgi:hypothetical protein